MRKNVMLWAVVLFAPLAAYGQNLHPEVQVTNTYEGTEAALPKPGLPMALPDSLTRFDYHFDYSVFDTPYKGAYEFSPYRIQMTPEGRRDDRGTLLVRAGAGYAFRPLLDVVWAPVKAGKWSLNVFGHVAGYAGMYAGKPWQPGERSFSAYDFGSRLGLDARLALKPVEIKLEGGYEGVFASDPEASGQDAARLEPFYCFPAYHSPYVRGRVKSSSELGRRVLLDLGAEYRGIWQGASRDHILRFDGTVAPRITDNIRARVDFNLCWSSLFYVGGSIAPKADFRWGPLNLTAGLRLGYAERFTVYPDVQASVRLWQDRLFLFAAVTGQDMLFTYADLKAADHRYWASSYGVPRPAAEWINASGGVRGNTGFGLQYELRGGYKEVREPLFGFRPLDAGHVVEQLYMVDDHAWYARLLLAWKSERLDVDARGELRTSRLDFSAPAAEGLVGPALFRGGCRATYNWRRRVFAGISLAGATGREIRLQGQAGRLPGYVDLGLHAEYRIDSRWGVWLKGSNLLHQQVYVSPVYREIYPSLTLGGTFQL